ncbi:unnamed protein product [Timema podura]|uniref:Uncharacterized protein n=1 Tax=Timema podura TaxID=61482 RepID=A0ABN7NPG5_TIMPD|nr:unnamed protein product [Timema podura]
MVQTQRRQEVQGVIHSDNQKTRRLSPSDGPRSEKKDPSVLVEDFEPRVIGPEQPCFPGNSSSRRPSKGGLTPEDGRGRIWGSYREVDKYTFG